MQTVTLWNVFIFKWESVILRTQHDGSVRYTYLYVNTDERNRRVFIRDGRCSLMLSGLLLHDKRPRRSQGREKLQWSHRDGK